jgi:hypothetical protein
MNILNGVFANSIAVVIGGIIGIFLRKGIPERMNLLITQGLGLCVLYVGIDGLKVGGDMIVVVLSIVIGAVIGDLLDIDGKLKKMGAFLQSKVKGDFPIAEGFVTTSLFVCVGAMAIVGSLQSGLTGNHETLYAKALIDGVLAVIMASVLGIGVSFAGISLLLYEGLLTLSAGAISGLLTTAVVNEMTCVGSLLVISIAFNLLKITDIRVANLLPATFLPILLMIFL